jgi:hypothetical protein
MVHGPARMLDGLVKFEYVFHSFIHVDRLIEISNYGRSDLTFRL